VYVRDRIALQKQIQLLEQEIASQQGIRTTLLYLEKENDELRALVGASTTPSITAGVIARPPFSPYDTVIIDRGADDGIVSSAPVYYGASRALGYVRTVYNKHALITLFSSPNVETTVYVFGPNIFTTAYGEGGGVIRISVPQGVAITEGDIVTLPSLAGGVLGTVHTVRSVPTEPEQHAYVVLDVPLQSLRLVRVSTQSQIPATFEDALGITQEVERTLFTVPVPRDYSADAYASTTDATTTPPLEVVSE
jgi:cell shape-determining protein MreC